MERWSGEQRAFAVEAYLTSSFSLIAAQRKFCNRFNIPRIRDAPSKSLIRYWVARFRASGSVVPARHQGPVPSVSTEENMQRVSDSIMQNPRMSLRARSSALGIARSTLHEIIKKKLKFHPYKIQIIQKLNENDYQTRLTYAERMLATFSTDTRLRNIFFSDEAHFHLGGYVNKQNFRYWSPENPREMHEQPLHSEKVTVWCAISGREIIGPYFFENYHGQAVTVNSDRYCEMINSFFREKLRNSSFSNRNTWFQQDGATAHTAQASMIVVRELFPGKMISRFGDIPWPARSPDLSPCDFFLWGYLKSVVYRNEPTTTAQLKENIRTEMAGISSDLCGRVFENMRQRWEECLRQEGRHLENIIFKK